MEINFIMKNLIFKKKVVFLVLLSLVLVFFCFNLKKTTTIEEEKNFTNTVEDRKIFKEEWMYDIIKQKVNIINFDVKKNKNKECEVFLRNINTNKDFVIRYGDSNSKPVTITYKSINKSCSFINNYIDIEGEYVYRIDKTKKNKVIISKYLQDGELIDEKSFNIDTLLKKQNHKFYPMGIEYMENNQIYVQYKVSMKYGGIAVFNLDTGKIEDIVKVNFCPEKYDENYIYGNKDGAFIIADRKTGNILLKSVEKALRLPVYMVSYSNGAVYYITVDGELYSESVKNDTFTYLGVINDEYYRKYLPVGCQVITPYEFYIIYSQGFLRKNEDEFDGELDGIFIVKYKKDRNYTGNIN